MSWIREQFTFSDLLGSSDKCTFVPGAYIVKEGNVGTHMYIILNGEARVLKSGRGGEVELARLRAADELLVWRL